MNDLVLVQKSVSTLDLQSRGWGGLSDGIRGSTLGAMLDCFMRERSFFRENGSMDGAANAKKRKGKERKSRNVLDLAEHKQVQGNQKLCHSQRFLRMPAEGTRPTA